MLDETWQAYTNQDTERNFAKPFVEQDPFYGVSGILERLMTRANEIRHPSRWLALDEEIIHLLGKYGVIQYAKDKKNQRGPKVFALNGSNFLGTTIGSLIEMTGTGFKKGYYHWIELYRGKKRDYPTPFSVFGKGFDIVCRAILDLNLRYQGYLLVCDSWYTSIPLMLQLFYWGVNYLGTIGSNRKGLKTSQEVNQFSDLKRALAKDYDEKIGGEEGAEIPTSGERKKYQGYKKGYFAIRKIDGLPVIVNVQKDNKVVLEGGNSIPMNETTEVWRYNKKVRKKESICVWIGHALINLIYGNLDQGTSWRTKAGGHKWKATRFSKTMLHYAMFGVLPTNSFLNMKLANPHDKRTYRQFKVSVCRWSMIHAPAFGLRERKRKVKVENNLVVEENDESIRRSKTNPYACDYNKRVPPKKQLQAAINCSKHGPFRFILINDILGGDRPARVRCAWQDNMEDSNTRCPN